jgi:DNA-binding response OmpR family regulator
VLIVEDETTLISTLSYNLRREGFNVVTATDGLEGLHTAQRLQPDIAILDLRLPTMPRLEVCRRLRAESDIPIIILTAKGEETDRVVGLEVGADDYMVKPFGMRELIARVHALLRRAQLGDSGKKSRITAGNIDVDLRGRSARRAGVEVQLKPKEFDVLVFLAKNAGRVFTREQVLEHVWGYEFFGGSRTVDVHIRWLREKLEDEPSRPRHLITVRGVGYKFVR